MSEVNQILQVIQNAGLRHPDDQLLECLLQDSTDPASTARYMLQRCSTGSDDFNLMPVLADWKRLIDSCTYRILGIDYIDPLITTVSCETPPQQAPDSCFVARIMKRDGGRCFVTGLEGSLLDPLLVSPILRMSKPIDESLYELLSIFLGPEMQQRLLSRTAYPNHPGDYWLVRKSAAAAVSKGYFQFTLRTGCKYSVAAIRIGGPTWPSILDKVPVLRFASFADHSKTPDLSLLKVLSRLAKPMRWLLVSYEITSKEKAVSKRLQSTTNMPLSSFIRHISEHVVSAFITAWSLVPATFRVHAYRCLSLLGAYLYEPSISRKVQRLPFGMYLKMLDAEQHEVLANEHGALQLARRYTHIPVPRPLDLVTNGGHSYLLTSQVPGLRLGMCIDAMSDREVDSLVCNLQKCIRELRAIQKNVAPDYMITNAVGKACFDYRIIAGSDYDEERGDLAGPFIDETDFNNKLQVGALPDVAHHIGHRIFFSHADLNMRNILIHNGRLSGIVDWENSGWYPEYWDYTKAYFITKLHKRWLRIIDRVFEPLGDYKSELAIERQIWEYCY